MSQPITDYQSFFSGALQAIEDTANLKQEEDQLRSEEARTRTELEAEEKKLKADIDRSIKERLNEINRTYDGEISKAKDELKKAQAKREKARNQSVKARIAEETKGPLDEAAEKLRNMKEAFRKQHMPAFTTTRLYYSLFMPHRFKDFLLLVFLIVICFIAVPCGIYFLALPENLRSPVLLAVIYVLSVLIFGGLYTWIGNSSKSKYTDMLRMGKETWDDLAANQKQVRKLTRQIRRDKNEERYNLGAYDDEIARASQAVQEAEARKQEALTNFDTVTKNIITDELTQNSSEKIGRLMSAHDEALRLLQEVGEEKRQKEKTLQEQYEVRLGREFMSEEKIEALSDILTRGSASSLADAMTEYRTGRDNKEK